MKTNAMIYFECSNGMIMSKIALSKLDKTTKLKNITNNIQDNLSLNDLKNYVFKNNIQIIFYITNKENKLDLDKKDLRIIHIDLNHFLAFPDKY